MKVEINLLCNHESMGNRNDSREKEGEVCMPDVRWPNDFAGMESHVCSVRQFSKNATVSCKCVMLMCHANVNVSYYATHKQSVWTLQPLFSGIHLLATA